MRVARRLCVGKLRKVYVASTELMTRNTSSGSENLPRDCKGLVPWLRNGFTGYTPFASGRKSKKLGVAGSTKYGVTFTLSLLLMPRFVSECTTFRFALSWSFDPARCVTLSRSDCLS